MYGARLLPAVEASKWWCGKHAGLPFEIALHCEGKDYTPEGIGIWNYYVYLPERLLKERFAEVWIEDKEYQCTPTTPKRITHDYYSVPALHYGEMHHGITFYEKAGHTVGHRCVKIGCDYNHSWDRERPSPELEEVIADCCVSCEKLAAHFGLSESP